jgi:hypothetical protein
MGFMMSDSRTAQIETYLEHAEVRMMQASCSDAATGETLYQEATDLLIRAEGLMKGSGAWLMACMHARRENGTLCVQWLERARTSSMLPDVETIRAHPYFAQARETTWFEDWAKERG